MDNATSQPHSTQPPLPIGENAILADTGPAVADMTTLQANAIHRRALNTSRRELRDQRRVTSAAEAVAGFKPGIEIFGFTKGAFSLIDLLRALLDISGPAALAISTWTAAKYDAAEVLDFIHSGKVTETRWLVDFSFQRRCPEVANEIRWLFGTDSIRVAKNHAKFVLLTNTQWQIVVRTSMNLNTNPRFEDFTIAHDPQLAAFLNSIIEEIWQRQAGSLALSRPHEIETWWERHA